MAWRRLGDKPLSEPMMVSLPTHICVTRPQCVKEWLGVRSMPSDYPNQYRIIANGTPGRKFRDNWFKTKKDHELRSLKWFSKQNSILNVQSTTEVLPFWVIFFESSGTYVQSLFPFQNRDAAKNFNWSPYSY